MDPPSNEHVEDAVQLLIEIDALTISRDCSKELLTPLGKGKYILCFYCVVQ